MPIISTVFGIGPIVSTVLIAVIAVIAVIGNGPQFKKARDLPAWLGLVPKQYSTDGKSSLAWISKRGNSYLRQMVIQGAKALKMHMKRDKSSLDEWVVRLEVGHHHHVVLIALVNKIMQIFWKVLTSSRGYQQYPNASSVV